MAQKDMAQATYPRTEPANRLNWFNSWSVSCRRFHCQRRGPI